MKNTMLTIRLRDAHYTLTIGMHLEKALLSAVAANASTRIAVVTDSNVAKLWGKHIVSTLNQSGKPVELFSFPAGERHKTQKTVTTLQHALLKKRFGRDTLLVALGGGVVGDVSGFVAATYLRGVPYIQVPTTLLAMVDSSIGGKVGIDTPYGKNTVGAFHQPQAVIIDMQFLKTLSRQHMTSGLLEAIKTFMTSDPKMLSDAIKLDQSDPLTKPELLQKIISRSVNIKGGVTMRDEREKGERKILNLGHTIGHALELLSGYRMLHGHAVGYGILVESKIAELLGVMTPKQRAWIAAYLEEFGITGKGIRKFSASKILSAAQADKKAQAGIAYYVLLESLGTIHTKGGMFAHPVPKAIVRKALRAVTT